MPASRTLARVEKLLRLLKRNRFVAELNRRYKVRQTARLTSELATKYHALVSARGTVYSETHAVEQVRRSVHQRITTTASGKPRIFWVGANWDQDSSGFIDGLRRVGQVMTFTNRDGGYGLLFRQDKSPTRLYDPDVVRSNSECLERQVAAALRDGPIHMVAGQMWANFISAATLESIQRLGIVTVNISMDDRLPEHWMTHQGVRLGSVGLIRGLDLVLTTSPECCLWYAVEGCPAIFWPLASDPKRFHPSAERDKQYDVSFVGNKYGMREKVVTTIQRAGITVAAFGAGWPSGPVDADRAAKIFGRSRIILGVGTVGHHHDRYTLKLRDFDAPMAGALYITHRNPDLLNLFHEGTEIECYSSIEECVDKVKYYLAHDERRRAVADAGLIRARNDHTWDQRFAQLFSVLSLPIHL